MKIIKLNQNPQGFGDIVEKLEKGMFESALPTQHTHCYYENKILGLSIGVWDSTDMIATAEPYSCDKFITIIEGAAEIKNIRTGKVESILAGESFVIPQGYNCQWHQNAYLRTFYVSYAPPDESIPDTPVCEHIITIGEQTASPWQETSDGFNKKVLYQSQNKRFTAGIWQGNSFSTDFITFPYNEFIMLKQGSLLCTATNGVEHKINLGQACFIPKGTRCSWQAKEKVTLHFVHIK